jgi:hypothetical protein
MQVIKNQGAAKPASRVEGLGWAGSKQCKPRRCWAKQIEQIKPAKAEEQLGGSWHKTFANLKLLHIQTAHGLWVLQSEHPLVAHRRICHNGATPGCVVNQAGVALRSRDPHALMRDDAVQGLGQHRLALNHLGLHNLLTSLAAATTHLASGTGMPAMGLACGILSYK